MSKHRVGVLKVVSKQLSVTAAAAEYAGEEHGHPQTQGKIERFHQTLKRWLEHQPTVRTLAELQVQLDEFRAEYNERRRHRAIGRVTPAEAYGATPKA